MQPMKSLLRQIEHIKAVARGYFWLPCPICGEMYGGHEPHGHWSTDWGGGVSTCINCKEEAAKRTKVLYDDYAKNWHMNLNTGALERNE